MKKLRFRQIHLDFHTSEHIGSVGENFDPTRFARTLKDACVDSINLFARCHHGMIYYDTRFPCRHPGLKRNLLKEQIEACRKLGINTVVYVTAGWDEYVARTHPEWLERTPESRPVGAGALEPGWKKICFNTPYVDYLEAQIVEVLESFGDAVDALWIDITFQTPCCCAFCLERMQAEGLDPAKPADRRTNADNVLLRLRERLTATIRKHSPECGIFYNAGHIGPYIRRFLHTYTHLDIESLPGSRDIWGYEHFPITVRYVKTLGVEYAGMTGKFHTLWGDFGGFKNLPALEYECFTAIAHGAKCSIGDQLHPSGAICQATYNLIGKVYRQVQEKEPWCADVTAVSEIGLFTPESPTGTGFTGLSPEIRGAYRMLAESHHQFDVIDAESDFARYQVLVLPDVIEVDEGLKSKLGGYLRNGGRLLLSYRSGMGCGQQSFALDEIGVRSAGDSPYEQEYAAPRPPLPEGLAATPYVLYKRGLRVEPLPGTEVLADLWQPYFNRTYAHFCSHRQTPYEKPSGYPAATLRGNVAYFAHPVFSMYHVYGARAYKLLVLASLRRLLPDPLIKTNAPTTAQINLNYQETHGRYVVHVLHYIPEARFKEVDIVEEVIPLFDVELCVKLPGKPARAYLAPSQRELAFTFENGYARVVVPEVRGHQMVVFEASGT